MFWRKGELVELYCPCKRIQLAGAAFGRAVNFCDMRFIQAIAAVRSTGFNRKLAASLQLRFSLKAPKGGTTNTVSRKSQSQRVEVASKRKLIPRSGDNCCPICPQSRSSFCSRFSISGFDLLVRFYSLFIDLGSFRLPMDFVSTKQQHFNSAKMPATVVARIGQGRG